MVWSPRRRHGPVGLSGVLGGDAAVAGLNCAVCEIQAELEPGADSLLYCDGPWLLRHHPHPSPLVGWLLLDTRRHVPGPDAFDEAEAAAFGPMLRRCCALVKELAGCDRVYAIAFGEGARHFHLHLIPRHGADSGTESWRVADLYRAVVAGEQLPADPVAVASFLCQARARCACW